MKNLKVIGPVDQGAYDRATVIASRLIGVGRWSTGYARRIPTRKATADGRELWIDDAYEMHTRMFGIEGVTLDKVVIEPYYDGLRAYLPSVIPVSIEIPVTAKTESQTLKELLSVDVDMLGPIDALNLLYRLQRMARLEVQS